jgi:hypothetical protein
MFNNKSAMAQINALLEMNEAALERLTSKQKEASHVADHRWDYTRGELTKLYKSTTPKTVSLSHVDAPNVKVEYALADVVQALADHLNFGVVPEHGPEIVVLNGGEVKPIAFTGS